MPTSAPVVAEVYRKLGGREGLGAEVSSEADLARLVRGRIPLRVLAHVKREGFSESEIDRFIIPARTRRHRKARRERLSVEEPIAWCGSRGSRPWPRTFSAMPRRPTSGCAKA